jgi:hypothetical protein
MLCTWRSGTVEASRALSARFEIEDTAAVQEELDAAIADGSVSFIGCSRRATGLVVA